jgi:hypothetical protein
VGFSFYLHACHHFNRMKSLKQTQRVHPRFADEIRFALAPHSQPRPADLARKAFSELQVRLLQPLLFASSDALTRKHLSLAANEAAALAWTTPYPLLVLPVLLDEKVAETRQHARRQEEIRVATSARRYRHGY